MAGAVDMAARGLATSIEPTQINASNAPASGQVLSVVGGKFVYTDNGEGGSDAKDLKVSATDSTAAFLADKLSGTSNKVTITKQSSSGVEKLIVNVGSDIFDKSTHTTSDITESADKKFLSADEKTNVGKLLSTGIGGKYLNDKGVYTTVPTSYTLGNYAAAYEYNTDGKMSKETVTGDITRVTTYTYIASGLENAGKLYQEVITENGYKITSTFTYDSTGKVTNIATATVAI